MDCDKKHLVSLIIIIGIVCIILQRECLEKAEVQSYIGFPFYFEG